VKLVVFNDDDFGYWKKRTRNYLLSLGHAIWEIVQEVYVVTSPRLNRINSILIPLSCNFFSGSPPAKNSGVKRA
jgi:hypothetical protein